MAIIPAFQAGDESSILSTRTKLKIFRQPKVVAFLC